jgi:outer membrane protein
MKRIDRGIILGGLACGALAGCGASSTARLAPKAPDRPWRQDAAKSGESTRFELQSDAALPFNGDEGLLDANHVYNLPELIDLAERANPDTRLAWEKARRSAFAVGLIESAYLPQISAEVIGGIQHTPLPIPQSLIGRGYFNLDTNEVLPGLVLKWLLFDFGKRAGMVKAAKQISIAADIAFTGAHQKLIFEVSRSYFALDAERAQLQVAEDALKTSQVLQDAAESKRQRGLATITEVALARRTTARAQFELERAKAADNDAFHGLLESMGVKPTFKLRIAESEARELNTTLAGEANAYIERALSRRPDVLASLAQLRASEAEISSAESSYYPTIGVEGWVNQNVGGFSIDGGPSYRVNEPAAGILFKLSLPLYDGGSRKNAVNIARSGSAAAKAELLKTQNEAIRQVARTYDAVKSALAEYEAALALVAASNTAYSAALDSYRHGVGTLTDAVMAESEKSRAQSEKAHAYSSVLTAAAALAFSTGELTSAEPVSNHP